MRYELHLTEAAADTRARLDDKRRAAFDKGVDILANDPFNEHSRPAGGDDTSRTIRVTPSLLVEYIVHRGYVVIVVLRVFDNQDVLLPDAD
ncbi:type II toxin-antitoxin system RelE family toxin [Streptomyces mayteni]